MLRVSLIKSQLIAVSCLALTLTALLAPQMAYAKYNPDHPEVKSLVDEGLQYLEGKSVSQTGEQMLVGLAFLKGQDDKNHPKIKEAAARAQEMASKPTEGEMAKDNAVYPVGVAIIFLCELDPVKYRSDIQTLLNWMLKVQKPFGGWGYLGGPHGNQGDTSMTQYGALSMWTAARKGFEVPDEHIAAVANWLLRTQDPSGGWGYQGVDPGNYNRVPQKPVTPSLTAAGTGSLYISGDLLGLKQVKEQKGSDLPPGVKLIEKKEELKRKPSDMVNIGRFNAGVGGGNSWFAKNGGINKDIAWVYYYMYALERYMSFYEYAQYGGHQENAIWYDAGVDFLKKQQHKDGFWSAQSGPVPGTCFAVLFLVRSTQKSIKEAAKPVGGELAGGKGLSGAIGNAVVRNGKIETKEVKEVSAIDNIDDIIGRLDQNVGAEVSLPPQIMLPKDLTQREQQLEKLRKLVSANNYDARLLAVNTLISDHSLDNVPVLIYALTDPNHRIFIPARDELRYLSRRFNGFNMPDTPTPAQKLKAAEDWRDWYYALRPEAQEKEEVVIPKEEDIK